MVSNSGGLTIIFMPVVAERGTNMVVTPAMLAVGAGNPGRPNRGEVGDRTGLGPPARPIGLLKGVKKG